jgi:alkylhydroperoxidase family enzyme
MITAPKPLFQPSTVGAASKASRAALKKIQKASGLIPSQAAIFAHNPIVLRGYMGLDAVFEKGCFTPRERQLILLAASAENHCNYCTAARSRVLKAVLRMTPDTVIAARIGMPVVDPKLDALATLVEELVHERGYAKEEAIRKFIAVGYRKEQVMELLLGIALKTISNYLDHIPPVPVDRSYTAGSK